jgi:hypothetical protein
MQFDLDHYTGWKGAPADPVPTSGRATREGNEGRETMRESKGQQKESPRQKLGSKSKGKRAQPKGTGLRKLRKNKGRGQS